MKNVIIDGIEYTPVKKRSGNRAVLVIDRGWIYAGDVTEENGRIRLDRAVHVFKWASIGFSKVIENPLDKNVDLRQMPEPVDVPAHSEIYRVPVCDNWGLK